MAVNKYKKNQFRNIPWIFPRNVAHGCCYKWPHTWELETIHTYSLQFLRSEVPNQFQWIKLEVSAGLAHSGCSQGESASLLFPVSGHCPQSLVSWFLIAIASFSLLLLSHSCSPGFKSPSTCLLKSLLVITFRANPGSLYNHTCKFSFAI